MLDIHGQKTSWPSRRPKEICLYFDSVNVEDLIRLTKGCESYLGGVQLLIMHGHGRQADPQNFHLVYIHVIVCITNTAGKKCIFKIKEDKISAVII